MIGVLRESYSSERWSDEIRLSKDERLTAIKGLEVALGFMQLIANTTDTHHDDGRPRFNVWLTSEVDRLLDRLKRAEKE